ncbi:MAG: phenylalanine--tRNA ligase subunit beta [Candidatus Saelkia tenebricola]|nr:phenylalanine--tRNA ligase subunit beta [Candidatus Saelkia tenebricola]
MKVLLSWLKDFVDIDVSVEQLADTLTKNGLEVGEIQSVGEDFVLDIEITPNRPDCLSIVGVARECAIGLSKRFTPPRLIFLPKISSAYLKETKFGVTIGAQEACLRYIGRVLLDVEIAPSPDFIKERLEKIGLRSINNVVDITNYILIETGQPMHAFDYDKIEGKQIIVRFAKEGEQIISLDETQRQLSKQDLVIADIKRPIALAGIMGGYDTEVTSKTRNVVLESAFFHPQTIRKAAQRHALTTEASYRFERGVDFPTVDTASVYAVDLISKYASRSSNKTTVIIDKTVDVIIKQVALSSKVVLKYEDVEKVLGIMPSVFWIRKLIKNLGCEIMSVSKESLKIQAPSTRSDLKINIDYIEEIARFYGYDKIPSQGLPELMVEKEPVLKNFSEKDFENQAKDVFIKTGLREVITYALLSEDEIEELKIKNTLPLKNPLAKSYSVLRPVIFPSLLKVAKYNFNRGVYDLAIFELGKVYSSINSEPCERKVAGILLSGKKYQDCFGNEIEYNFYDLKFAVETLLSYFKISDYSIKEAKQMFFSNSCSAEISVSNEKSALIGKVSGKIKTYYDLKRDIYIGEIYLDTIKKGMKNVIRHQKITQYPFIDRDFSLLLPKAVSAGEIIEHIQGKNDLICAVDIIDVYEGKQIPLDMKSITIRIRFQSDEKTLKDVEVDRICEGVKETLVKELPCQIRK